MMNLDLGLEAFTRASSRTPSIDPFPPWLLFSYVSTKFFASPSIKNSCFVLHLGLDGPHQGASIAHENTRDKYIQFHNFDYMWHGPLMVFPMMLTSTHEFISYGKDD
jgi:hypothetical protein